MREASGRAVNAIVEAGTGHHGISMLWTYIHPTPEILIHQYVFETPIDETSTKIYLINTRNFLTDPKDDERVMERNQVVAFQDRDVQVNISPVLTPNKINNEFFVPMDRPIKRYRELMEKWEQKGWRIDSETVAQNRLSHAYAIPSPGRKETKGWVVDSIPIL